MGFCGEMYKFSSGAGACPRKVKDFLMTEIKG